MQSVLQIEQWGQRNGRQDINTAEHFPLDNLQEGNERSCLAKRQKKHYLYFKNGFHTNLAFRIVLPSGCAMLIVLGGGSCKLSG